MKQSKNSNATDHTSDPSNALHTVPFPFLPFFSDQAAVSDALGWGRQRSKPAASPPRRWGSRQVATPPASRDATHRLDEGLLLATRAVACEGGRRSSDLPWTATSPSVSRIGHRRSSGRRPWQATLGGCCGTRGSGTAHNHGIF